MLTVLALDLGTSCGWAMSDAGVLVSGTQHLPSDSIGHRMLYFGEWLNPMLVGCRTVWYEAPHAHSGASRDIVYGLQGVLLGECVRVGADARRVAANTLKKWTTGNGACGKLAMVERASAIARRTITDHNEADAVCLLAMALDALGRAA